jgi:hypothetical protein
LKSHYDLLSVAANAPDDEIKKAFRREIARYHPDKVQHLGKEFQDMAAGVAADLTEAYRVLMDPALRAQYDQNLRGRAAAPPSAAPVQPSNASRPEAAGSRPEAPPPPADHAAARSSAGLDFVRRAALTKIREAVQEVMANADAMPAPGFDVAVVSRPKKGLFRKADESVCLLVKFVARVDADAVAAVWPAALKVIAPGPSACVLLLAGPEMATARELAEAVTELRRKLRRPGAVLVPVDVRDWETLFPPDTPAVVRSLIQRLKHDAR